MFVDPKIYTQIKLKEFNFEDNFINATTHLFEQMCILSEYAGCFRLSVELYIIAKYYGYEPKLKYGICINTVSECKFDHVWLEINGITIDLAIYGNINFRPFKSSKDQPQYTPIIEKTELLQVKNSPDTMTKRFYYKECNIDRHWDDKSMIDAINTKTIRQYLDDGIKHINMYFEIECCVNPVFSEHFLATILKIANETKLSEFKV